MLVYGGLTQRYRDFEALNLVQQQQKKDNVAIEGDIDIYDVYNNCEDYLDLNPDVEELPYHVRTCGEEMLNDIQIYNTRAKTWTWIKPSFNANIYLYVKQPSARYGHAGTYVELIDQDTYYRDGTTKLLRKFLYIYGGFSLDCETSCYDLWRYEISYGPMAMYPKKDEEWHNRGNHWTLMSENLNYGPGARVHTTMVATQAFPNEISSRDEHYIYVFGGIKVHNEDTHNTLKRNKTEKSSFEYKGDLWRYDLLSDQWEDIEVYGIASIRRQIYMWNGEPLTSDVSTKDKLKQDLNNVNKK